MQEERSKACLVPAIGSFVVRKFDARDCTERINSVHRTQQCVLGSRNVPISKLASRPCEKTSAHMKWNKWKGTESLAHVENQEVVPILQLHTQKTGTNSYALYKHFTHMLEIVRRASTSCINMGVARKRRKELKPSPLYFCHQGK